MTAIDVTETLLIIASFFAAGFALLSVLSLLPGTSKQSRQLWPTLLSELVILGVAGLAIYLGGAVLLVALIAMAFRVGYEAASVAFTRPPLAGSRSAALTAGVAVAVLSYLATLLPLGVAVACGAAAAVALFAFLALRHRHKASFANALGEFLLFPGVAVAVFVAAAVNPPYAALLLVLFLLVETYDSYSLLGGKLFGRRPAFPRLSPRKTVEGLLTGAVALAITAALVGHYVFGLSAWICIQVAIAVGVLSTAGDLAASRLKRIAGVKDYPLIMPGQGGLFDIVDAWLMTGLVIVTLVVLSGTL